VYTDVALRLDYAEVTTQPHNLLQSCNSEGNHVT